MERDDRLSFLELKNLTGQFVVNLHLKESYYNIPQCYYYITNSFDLKASDYFDSDNILRPYPYKVSVFTITGLPDKVLEGYVNSINDIDNVNNDLTFLFIEFVNSFLKTSKPNQALRHCYYFQDSIKDALSSKASKTLKTFHDFLIEFSSFVEHKMIFYEKLIKLDNYDQFIRLKQPLLNDSVILWKLSEDELSEIADFYLNIISLSKGQINRDLMKAILIEIFNGNSEIDYLILTGKKYQIADTFLQLYKNGKIRSKTRADFVNWVNNKFRLVEGDQYSYIGNALDDLLKKGRGQPALKKRLNLPGFLDYYLYIKDKKEFIPQKR